MFCIKLQRQLKMSMKYKKVTVACEATVSFFYRSAFDELTPSHS